MGRLNQYFESLEIWTFPGKFDDFIELKKYT